MLTVKHIDIGGNEYIYSVFSTELRKEEIDGEDKESIVKPNRLLGFTEDRHVVCEITSGTIFIMNKDGQTVSRYDLTASPVDLEANPKSTFNK